jgi:hypothetical protein
MMAVSRSDSSLQLRQQLAASYCQVNDVLNSLKIEVHYPAHAVTYACES